MSKTYHTTSTGRFYLGRSDVQQQVVLYTPFGNVSELWDEGDVEYDRDMEPAEVLDLIESRLNAYWICTGREEKLAKIATIRANLTAVTRDWAQSMAVRYQAEASRAARKARAFVDLALENEQ